MSPVNVEKPLEIIGREARFLPRKSVIELTPLVPCPEIAMPTETWFPTIVFYEDLPLDPAVKQGVMDAIRERAAIVLATHETDTVTAFNAPNDLHHDPRVAPLFEVFRPHLQHFLVDILHIDTEQIEFYVGRCWPVVGGDDEGGATHIHNGGIFSGVYYLQVPEGAGAAEIYKPYRTPHDSLAMTELSELTYQRAEYPAVENRLMLFSSALQHRRLPRTEPSETDRVAIAFDLYTMAAIEASGSGAPHYKYFEKLF
jgi:uncharacterized protein (TIGR02466 family)